MGRQWLVSAAIEASAHHKIWWIVQNSEGKDGTTHPHLEVSSPSTLDRYPLPLLQPSSTAPIASHNSYTSGVV
jgi:hypothetical protein